MGQSKVPEPAHSFDDAVAAANRIRVGRARRNADPDLDFYPAHVVDDDDVDAAIEYLHRYRRAPEDVQRAELADRALLISYQRQRDQRRSEARELAVLETALRVKARPSRWAFNLGLSRQNVWHRKRILAARVRGAEIPPTRAQAERERRQAGTVEAWLEANARELLDAGEFLVQHAALLAPLLLPDKASSLSEAFAAVETHRGRPSLALASAVGYAMWLLAPAIDDCDDPVIRAVISRGQTLRDEFNARVATQA